MGQYHIARINGVSPRPNYWVCPGTHLSPTFIIYYMRLHSRSYTCTSYHTFCSSFGRTANLECGPSAIGAVRPILLPSNTTYLVLGISNSGVPNMFVSVMLGQVSCTVPSHVGRTRAHTLISQPGFCNVYVCLTLCCV